MKSLSRHVAMACVFLACAVSFAEQPVLRVLTYNIHHGRGADGRIDLPRIAAVIRKLETDLVALQEVDRLTKRCGQVDQAAELGRLTGMHHAFGKAMDFDGGQYGEAVLSRFEFIEVKTYALSASAGHEPRAALAVTVHPSNFPVLTFVGTHLDHTRDPKDRVSQARAIDKLFADRQNTSVVLAGDLNARPATDPMRVFDDHWSSAATFVGKEPAPTFPSKNPRTKIDYVLLRKADRWRAKRVQVVDEPVASDHAPLLAELQYVEVQ